MIGGPFQSIDWNLALGILTYRLKRPDTLYCCGNDFLTQKAHMCGYCLLY